MVKVGDTVKILEGHNHITKGWAETGATLTVTDVYDGLTIWGQPRIRVFNDVDRAVRLSHSKYQLILSIEAESQEL